MNRFPRNFINIAILATVAALALKATAGDAGPVAYPADYRAWTHVKSMLIQDDHPLADPFAGIHHIYANAEAMEGYLGGNFPEGAVIVFDLLEYAAADGAITEGARKLVGVMQRDSGRFAATGGWGFEGFAGDSRTERLVTDDGAGCFGCHLAQRESEYVFSAWRE